MGVQKVDKIKHCSLTIFAVVSQSNVQVFFEIIKAVPGMHLACSLSWTTVNVKIMLYLRLHYYRSALSL